MIVSGHTHRAYNCSIAGHLVTSAASYGRLITRVSLTIDRATGVVARAAAVNEIVTRDVPKDPVQTALVIQVRRARRSDCQTDRRLGHRQHHP